MALVRFTRRQPRIAFPGAAGQSLFPAFDDVESGMNRIMERVFNEPFALTALPETIGWVPAMEVAETPKELTLTAELPGIDQKDVDVSVEDGLLTIRGEKTEERKEQDEKEKKVYLYERSYGAFQRSLTLPSTVDSSKITATFDKGVLKVTMPKSEEVKAKGRKVEIKAT